MERLEHIGKPVPKMVKRVRIWLEMGYRKNCHRPGTKSRIFIPPIHEWLFHELPELEVTNAKDMDMIELWDDRCVQVVPNTGNPVGPNPEPYRRL